MNTSARVETWSPSAEAALDAAVLDGFLCWRGRPHRMPAAHRHNDVEVNQVDAGTMGYLFGGVPVDVPAGGLIVFWAATPHQLVRCPDASVSWLTIPLQQFLGWRLPGSFVGRVLPGPVLLAAAGTGLPDPFVRWQADLQPGRPYDRRTAALEIQAFVRRLAGGLAPEAGSVEAPDDTAVMRAATMALYISRNLAAPISVEMVARSANLSPQYAMSLFHAVVGSTIVGYVTQCRVAEAQRLLITSDLPLTEVGSAVGFQSQSQFYSSFREACGTSPGAYRRTSDRSPESAEPGS